MSAEGNPEPAVAASTSPRAAEVASLPLDSLLSPQSTGFESLPARESTTELEFNDVVLDDEEQFSAVPLSARPNITKSMSSSQIVENDEQRNTVSNGPPDFTYTVERNTHKKSASNSTIRSARNLPFILARLDIQKVQDETDPKAHRSSMDGQQKIHEEFVRLQKERQEAEENAINAAIDWGAFELMKVPLDSHEVPSRRLLGSCHFW